ncbi:hypothetical protein GCM10027614_29130 [Micromonospora vulcania]
MAAGQVPPSRPGPRPASTISGTTDVSPGEGVGMTETFHEFVVQTALARTYRHWRRIRDGDPEAYVRRVMYHQQVSW